MNKENGITIKNLIYALLFLVFGIILLTDTTDLISLASKVLGIVLIIVGIVKSIVYIYMKGKLGDYDLSQLVVGLLVVCCGGLLLSYSSALSFAIRVIIGMWALFAGINRIILAISVKNNDQTGFTMYLSTSLIMIIIGVLLISGIFDQIIGLLIIIYSITEIVDYIYYKSKTKTDDVTIDTKEKKSTRKTKRIKSKKVVDAVIEEDTKK